VREKTAEWGDTPQKKDHRTEIQKIRDLASEEAIVRHEWETLLYRGAAMPALAMFVTKHRAWPMWFCEWSWLERERKQRRIPWL
jgi:hypothetical protein